MSSKLQSFAAGAHHDLFNGTINRAYTARCFVGRQPLVEASHFLVDNTNKKCIQHLRVIVGEHGDGKTTLAALLEHIAEISPNKWLCASIHAEQIELHPNASLHAAEFIRKLLRSLHCESPQTSKHIHVDIITLIREAIDIVEVLSSELGEDPVVMWHLAWEGFDLSVRLMMEKVFQYVVRPAFGETEHNFNLICEWLSGDVKELMYDGARINSLADDWRQMINIYLQLAKLAGYHGIMLVLDEMDVCYQHFSRRQNDRLQHFIREIVDWPDDERPEDIRLLFLIAVSQRWMSELTNYEALHARLRGTKGAPAKLTPVWDLNEYPIEENDWRKMCRHLLAISHLAGWPLAPSIRKSWLKDMNELFCKLTYQPGLMRAFQQECLATISSLSEGKFDDPVNWMLSEQIAGRLQIYLDEDRTEYGH
ncbi:hypothetical protein BA893_03305 [Vibrio natriegens]|uniref:BREX system ATP-binding domain-containing protein n=1 Tax=Vibrio natriegens TaxID=691 RepID=UPI0008045048|nr:BREX system ATP-binding domain-containing protein [Vibrio natriegens]ANQ20754.1 hypothetical protein BA893_03305 [Vibrio natriegens]